MDLSRPHRAVSPGLDGDILVTLAATRRPLTGRQIARRIPLASQDGVRKALQRLEGAGLVLTEQAGSANLHQLNRDHLAAASVLTLARLRIDLIERLRETFDGWASPPIHASLFGSAARGDGGADSDIDIFLVRPTIVGEDDSDWRAQVGQLTENVHRWTGNHIGLIEFGEENLPGLVGEQAPVLGELRRDAIDLAGTPVSRLLRPQGGAA